MPKMSIKRSVTVSAPAEKVFKIVSDFNHWSPWSPWLILEPGVKVDVREDSKYYEWDGSRVGSGNMTVLSEVENQSVKYDLTFLKPWKSTAKVAFELSETGDGTEVTWTMDSSLPFFLFWMKKITEAFVGMDYERGLSMLKNYVEDDRIDSNLNFNGEKAYEGCKYIGIETTTTKENLAPQMGSDFEKIWAYIGEHPELIDGFGLSIYKKWDMVKNRIDYICGVQVKDIPSDLPSGMIAGEIPSMTIHQVEHVGPYAYLGNAWTAQQMMMRGKEFKGNKKISPFEVYGNNPNETDEKDLITHVNFAVK